MPAQPGSTLFSKGVYGPSMGTSGGSNSIVAKHSTAISPSRSQVMSQVSVEVPVPEEKLVSDSKNNEEKIDHYHWLAHVVSFSASFMIGACCAMGAYRYITPNLMLIWPGHLGAVISVAVVAALAGFVLNWLLYHADGPKALTEFWGDCKRFGQIFTSSTPEKSPGWTRSIWVSLSNLLAIASGVSMYAFTMEATSSVMVGSAALWAPHWIVMLFALANAIGTFTLLRTQMAELVNKDKYEYSSFLEVKAGLLAGLKKFFSRIVGVGDIESDGETIKRSFGYLEITLRTVCAAVLVGAACFHSVRLCDTIRVAMVHLHFPMTIAWALFAAFLVSELVFNTKVVLWLTEQLAIWRDQSVVKRRVTQSNKSPLTVLAKLGTFLLVVVSTVLIAFNGIANGMMDLGAATHALSTIGWAALVIGTLFSMFVMSKAVCETVTFPTIKNAAGEDQRILKFQVPLPTGAWPEFICATGALFLCGGALYAQDVLMLHHAGISLNLFLLLPVLLTSCLLMHRGLRMCWPDDAHGLYMDPGGSTEVVGSSFPSPGLQIVTAESKPELGGTNADLGSGPKNFANVGIPEVVEVAGLVTADAG